MKLYGKSLLFELEGKPRGVIPIAVLLLGVLISLFSNGFRLLMADPKCFDLDRLPGLLFMPAEMVYLWGAALLLLKRSNIY